MRPHQQHQSEEAEKQRMLATLKGEFLPMLRMYWPTEKAPSILDGTWEPPLIPKVN